VPKKIVPVNLYNPHAEVDDEKKKPNPGPGTYRTMSEFGFQQDAGIYSPKSSRQ
jgi:hypothetical protein